MILDTQGKVIVQNRVIPYKLLVHRSDDIFKNDDKSVIIIAGSEGNIIKRYEIFL